MHYLLFYEVGEDYVSRRAEFRDAHLEKAWQASERGELVLGGALSNPIDGAVLLFRGDSAEVAEKFARADPYVTSGAVKRWHVREWTTVAGEDAAKPIRPKPAADGKTTRSVSSNPVDGSASSQDQDQDKGKGMILRMWRARATVEKSGDYIEHATKKVFPALGAIEGHRGAYLLRRAVGGAIELVVLTLWESMNAVRKFAGVKPEKAVVDPEARALLSSFDESVTHFEVVDRTGGTPKSCNRHSALSNTPTRHKNALSRAIAHLARSGAQQVSCLDDHNAGVGLFLSRAGGFLQRSSIRVVCGHRHHPGEAPGWVHGTGLFPEANRT